MPNSPRRLADIVQAMLAERGWRVAPSTPGPSASIKSDDSRLVFLGNWQHPCPRRLLFDPDLEAVDIVAWQVIRVHADASKAVAFPRYTDLMDGLKVSRATVARALAVLRLARWLPLCAALRDANGRFGGHVYALSDEPLPLGEVLEVDGGYVGFAEDAQSHRNAHVRTLAERTLQTIREAAAARDEDAFRPLQVGDLLAQRLADMIRLLGGTGAGATGSQSQPREGADADSTGGADRVQNLNAVNRVQNLNAVGSSSPLNKETTTTPDAQERGKRHDEHRDQTPLVFPSELSLTDSQRRVLLLRLQQIPPNLRQDVLDEAAGRVLVKRSTTDPVRCEFDYVARLCVKALEGHFVLTDAGERLRGRRRASAETQDRLRRAREYSEAQRLKTLEAHRARSETDRERD